MSCALKTAPRTTQERAPESYAVTLDDGSHPDEVVALARLVVGRWDAVRDLPATVETWSDDVGVRQVAERLAFRARLDLVSLVAALTGSFLEADCGLELDDRLFIVMPGANSACDADATLIIQDLKTGREIGCYCGRQ